MSGGGPVLIVELQECFSKFANYILTDRVHIGFVQSKADLHQVGGVLLTGLCWISVPLYALQYIRVKHGGSHAVKFLYHLMLYFIRKFYWAGVQIHVQIANNAIGNLQLG